MIGSFRAMCVLAGVALLAVAHGAGAAETGGEETDYRAELEKCHALDDTGQTTARGCYRELLAVVNDDAIRAEAHWRLGNTNAANDAFRRAATANEYDADVRARWGWLYLDVHQEGDAEALFSEALKLEPEHTEALLGIGELVAGRFEGRAHELVHSILAREPENPGANAILARMQLEVGEIELARAGLRLLLDNDGLGTRDRLNTYALLAAADHLQGVIPSEWTDKALELNPTFGDVFAVPAHFYIITRRYTEAVALLERAVEVDPDHWSARALLGSNLLRLNRFEEAQAHLESTYEGDPYNAEVVNILRLLDSMDDFDTIASDDLVLRTHQSETDVLQGYVRELVSLAESEMAGRYGYVMERPVVVELYQRHDDFAVRTAGLPGLGILGATFGDVIVMDGPSAQSAEGFDWLSALWHELAHVVTLNATRNLVSRWFSEGVSVFEEWRYGPSQNASVSLVFLEALVDDRLLPVAELDEGFIRPTYENQISVSYLQSGLLCEFIADRFDGGLTRMLVAYDEGATTVQAIEQALGVSPEELDDLFNEHLDVRFSTVVEQLGTLRKTMHEGSVAFGEERYAAALAAANAAIAIYPEYVGPSSPYLLAAQAAKELASAAGELGEVSAAVLSESNAPVSSEGSQNHHDTPANGDLFAALTDYWQRGGRNPQALEDLAGLYRTAGMPSSAIAVQAVLARAAPLVADHHDKLGDWLSADGQHAEALSEYRIAFALEPHDKASAHYKLASALYRLERTEEARRELLYALEIAPRFRPALTLLVEINQ